MSGPTQIRVRSTPGVLEVAVTEDERLLDYRLSFPAFPDGVDDLHHVVIGRLAPDLGGAFVRLGAEADGFLPLGEAGPAGEAGLVEGQAIAVRVTRAAQGGKGPRLSARLDDAVRAGCLAAPRGLVRRGPDALAAAAAAWPQAPILVDDLHQAAVLRAGFGARLRHDRAAVPEWLAAQIDGLAGSRVTLPGGMIASIVPTPALVAIDLDTASLRGSGAGKASAQFAANRDALPALLHQVRLRDLSGAILIDPAGLAPRKRAALAPVIASALARDPRAPRLVGFTGLGLIEIVRSRRHPPLHELRAGPAWTAARALCRWLDAPAGSLVAAPELAGHLAADMMARAEAERLAGRTLLIRTDPGLAAGQWHVEAGR